MESFSAPQDKNRMLLLLRNSSKKQAQKKVMEDGRIEYDIPLQRSILRPWAEKLCYEIVGELVEGGVSGYRLSADKRDAVIDMKARADRGEFDVLGIYMSDRLGRIADETPLIVSFLNARGIKVLSYTDGEISSQTHSDKLMTYIRFWQAEGESLKTSLRIRDAGVQSVLAGKWRGGCPPYGYRSVSRGTLNFKGKPIFDVEIDPEKAEVVKTVFRLYGKEHYGCRKIAKYLNDHDIKTEKGCMWTWSNITSMLKNKLYIGIYELGKWTGEIKAVSPVMEHLKIIDEKDFYEVQALIPKNILISGANRENANSPTQRATRNGSMLLTGLLFCECGKKFTNQHHRAVRQRADGTVWEYERSVYRCGSYYAPKEGQPSCNKRWLPTKELDDLIIKETKVFMNDIDREKLLNLHDEKSSERERLLVVGLKRYEKEIKQKEKEMQRLKDEVLKTLLGESDFSKELLSEMHQTAGTELENLRQKHEEMQSEIAGLKKMIETRKSIATDLEGWSERFDALDTMDKKSMLLNLIKHIVVHADAVEIEYSFRLEGFENNNNIFDGIENNDIMESKDTQAADNGENRTFFPSKLVKGCKQARFSPVSCFSVISTGLTLRR